MRIRKAVKLCDTWEWRFAWYPVCTPHFKFVWLEWVLRLRYFDGAFYHFSYLTKFEAVKKRLKITNKGAIEEKPSVVATFSYPSTTNYTAGGSNVGTASQSKKVP